MPRQERPSRLDKALQERMYFISHIPASASTAAHLFLVTGQSGNLYTVTLPTTNDDRPARCNCIDQRIRKTLCKHMLFTLLRVLKLPRSRLPTTDHGTIPLLTTTLLGEIESATHRIKSADVDAPDQVRSVVSAVAPGVMGVGREVAKREVKAGDECAICYEELLGEGMVFCRFGCGNAVHEDCFNRYRQATQEPVRCVLCRTIWDGVEGSEIGAGGLLVRRRLVNIAEVVPHAFMREDVRRLGLDKGSGGGGSALVRVSRMSRSGRNASRNTGSGSGVRDRIKKTGPSDRDLRMAAREERRRLAECKRDDGKNVNKGVGNKRMTRSKRSTGT